jgi:hypothetical protein
METLLKYLLITLLAVSLTPALAFMILLAVPLLAAEAIADAMPWLPQRQTLGSRQLEHVKIIAITKLS